MTPPPHCWEEGITTTDSDGSTTNWTPHGFSVVRGHGGSTFGAVRHTIAGLGSISGMWKERAIAGELIARADALRTCLAWEPEVAVGKITARCDFEIGADGHVRDIEIRYSKDMHYVDMENIEIEVPAHLRPVHDCLLAELHAIEFPRPAPNDFACTSMRFDPTARVGGIFRNRDLYE